MIGIVVVLGTISICYANVDVVNELMDIHTILIRQEREIKALKNENRVLRADVNKMQWRSILSRTGTITCLKIVKGLLFLEMISKGTTPVTK